MSQKPESIPGDRVAIVTGGAQGIGRAVALRLAADGFAVGVLDVAAEALARTNDELRAAGTRSLALTVNVRDATAVAAAISRIETGLGMVCVLVNCAGILVVRPTLEVPIDEWRLTIDTNLTGYFICAQAAARAMIARGTAGRIVNVASVHSESPGAGLAAYDASKGGILMLTRSLALEFAPFGITVNAVGPGLVVDTMLAGPTNEAYLAATIPNIPLGRAAVPDDVAGPVSFLCSADARYITGAMLYIDGGMLLTART